MKYKKFSNLDGPLYSITREDIQNINFENGEKELLEKNKTLVDTKTAANNDAVLNYGTEFPIQIETPVCTKDLSEGQYITFKTMADIDADGVKVIRAGTPVMGLVYKANRSSWWGTKGKLGVRLDHLALPDGTHIPVKGDIYVTGKNRTALSVLLFLFVTWPACFICGSKAELPYGFNTLARIGATVQFPPNGNPIVLNTKADSSTIVEPFRLSSLNTIPPLPCMATFSYYLSGLKEKVQVIKIDPYKGKIQYKKLTKKGKVNKSYKYTINENKLQNIEFEMPHY